MLTKLAIDGAIQNDDKLVAIFGGGYDSSQDVPGYSSDTAGNALYIIDAKSGKLLWRAGAEAGADLVLPEMDNSFAAPLRVIDINNDSFAFTPPISAAGSGASTSSMASPQRDSLRVVYSRLSGRPISTRRLWRTPGGSTFRRMCRSCDARTRCS